MGNYVTSSVTTTVVMDCVGGDHGPHVTVPSALNFVKCNSDVDVVLVGLRDAIEAELKVRGATSGPRLRVHHASEVVLMDESPALALRNKKDSSVRVAVELVKNGEAQACVSAGNTGALMAVSRFVLKTLPGIDRPAIIAALPSTQGSTYVLDLGANVDCGPEHLLQFAIMGATLVAAVEHKDRPSGCPRAGSISSATSRATGSTGVKPTSSYATASSATSCSRPPKEWCRWCAATFARSSCAVFLRGSPA